MRSLSLLIKPASGNCNMRCRYCFYADITDIREVKSHGFMSLETLEDIVKKALDETTHICTFGFQGGEPTLAGLDFFRAFVEYVRQYNKNKVQVLFSLQTNGMLIDEEWARFLADNKFLTGLSIDASKNVHDELRPNAVGKGTHNQCLKAARLLKKYAAEFNVLSVVTRQLAAHPEKAYNFYKQQDFHHIQFIPCLDGLKEEHGSNQYSLDAKRYANFLCRTFDLWYEDFVRDRYYSIRAFDNYIHVLAGHPPENCAMGGTCNAYALVEADGETYPCDFYALEKYRLGSVSTHSFEEMLRGEKAEAFVAPSRQTHEDCTGCDYFFICRGGCRRDREQAGGELGLNHYCTAYKQFFAHALPRMRGIAERVYGR